MTFQRAVLFRSASIRTVKPRFQARNVGLINTTSEHRQSTFLFVVLEKPRPAAGVSGKEDLRQTGPPNQPKPPPSLFTLQDSPGKISGLSPETKPEARRRRQGTTGFGFPPLHSLSYLGGGGVQTPKNRTPFTEDLHRLRRPFRTGWSPCGCVGIPPGRLALIRSQATGRASPPLCCRFRSVQRGSASTFPGEGRASLC